ncbi:MAG: hypothetical protein ACOC44_17345 [Promethearchaeia archaeon]
MEKETAKELISFKLRHIQGEIQSILKRWDEDNPDDFIVKARRGILENAEMDAITIRQLVADYHRLKKLLESVKSE